MANKIIIKNGAGAPPAGALSVAELGFDTTNKKVYIGHADGPIEVGVKGVAVDLQGATGIETVKSQNPLKFDEQSFYPLTTVDQVIMADGTRLKEAGSSLGLVKSGGDVTISDGVISVNNAATADKLSSTRTISLTGDVTGSGSFDGSGNLSIPTVVIDNSHNHSTMVNFTVGSSEGAPYIYNENNKLSFRLYNGSDYGYAWFNTDASFQATKVYGAVWNDYAEYRPQKEDIKPGYCVTSADNGQVYKTIEKFQACDGIVSDTFGFAIGETDECKTPLAVAGRVLAYCEGDKHNYHSGDTVCAGPNGKVVKMTREEIREWPDRIVGIVSEIPEYDTWGSGNIAVDGRIWIKVK